ncbi:RNA polymerase sigma-70 factor, ECF subfamily [bacterium A37T11]|nr:RNA polymerase sigma-70 factor, ECF subfamily [bacterium A37T11]
MDSYSKYTDAHLLYLLKISDERAFEEVYKRYSFVLLRHAQRMLTNKEECRDILQEVFIKLWEKRIYLLSDTNLSAYLYTLIRNRILDVLSHHKVQVNYLREATIMPPDAPLEADRLLREKELSRLIEQELAHMPGRMREVFVLSRYEYLSHHEIAVRLNISVFTVKSQINNAIHRIRVRLGL